VAVTPAQAERLAKLRVSDTLVDHWYEGMRLVVAVRAPRWTRFLEVDADGRLHEIQDETPA
jgi:hypothetical protein